MCLHNILERKCSIKTNKIIYSSFYYIAPRLSLTSSLKWIINPGQQKHQNVNSRNLIYVICIIQMALISVPYQLIDFL